MEGGGSVKHTRESIIAKWDTLSNLDRDEWVATVVMDIMGWSWSYHFFPWELIADAWRVLEKLRGKWFVRIADFGRHGWGVELVSETAAIPYVSVTRETVQEAICLAALIATLTGEAED